MNRKAILIIALAVTLITAYGFMPGNNQGKKGSRAGNNQSFRQGARGAMGILQIKDLTDEQKSKINDIVYNHRLKSLDTKNELEKNQIKMDQLMQADSPDENAILSLVEKNGELKTVLNKSRIEMMFELRGLLTPEQLEEFNNMPAPQMQGQGRGMDDRFDGKRPRMGMGRNQGDCLWNTPPEPPEETGDDTQE